LPSLAQPNRWVNGDRLGLEALLKEFRPRRLESSGDLGPIGGYPEAMARLVLGAFLQRVINGGAIPSRGKSPWAIGASIFAPGIRAYCPVELKIKVNQSLPEILKLI
jgi:hypothetical protein